MKPGGVVNLKKLNILSFLGKNKLIFLMFSFFIVGFLVSNFSFTDSRAARFSETLFNYYLSFRTNSSFLKMLFSVFFQYTAVAVIVFVVGSSMTGVVLSPLMCCSLGLYFGTLVSFTYSTYGLKGIAFNSVIIIPPALVFMICVLFEARESFVFSSVLLRLTFPKSRPINLSGEYKIYCGKFLLYVLFSFLAAIVDAAVSSSFIKYFSFV